MKSPPIKGKPAPAPRPFRSSPTPTTDSPVAAWGAPLGLALLCMAAYANSFDAGFALDSRQLILRDARVHALTHENLSLIAGHSYWWPLGESGLYRPLTTLSYLFNYAVLGHADRPAGYHWFNLLLHIANVLMLWRLVHRLTASEWTGATAASIWAVSPVSTEAVTNIVGRADLMAASGSLAVVLLYLRARERSEIAESDPRRRPPRRPPARRHLWTAGVALALTAGVLSKESAVAALALIVLCEAVGGTPRRSLPALAMTLAVCAVPLAAWLAQRAAVLGSSAPAEFPFTDNPIVGSTFWQGRLTAVQVTWRYLALLVWPKRLSNDYSHPQIPLAEGTAADWLACLLFVGGTVAVLWRLRAQRAVLFFAAFTFITFLPASNLLFAAGTIMGERLVYLPSAGLAALAAVGLRRLGTTRRGLWPASALAALIVIAYAARTYARNPDWKDDLTLWRTAVAAAPASAAAHRALAEALYDSDPTHSNLDEVIREAETSVALLERLPDERNSFQTFRRTGAYYLDKANQVEGGPRGEASPELRRLHARALNLLDRALLIARAGAARIHGASTEPEADAQRLRAAALLGLENPALALEAANRSRVLSPLHPLAYRTAAAALLAMGRPEEAAMTLLTGSAVSGDRGLLEEVMGLYRSGLDVEGCSLAGSGSAAALSPRCPVVLRHSCQAFAAAYQILRKAGYDARADQTKTAAVAGLRCSEDLMEQTSSLVP